MMSCPTKIYMMIIMFNKPLRVEYKGIARVSINFQHKWIYGT